VANQRALKPIGRAEGRLNDEGPVLPGPF
jgi:hypothetical protein